MTSSALFEKYDISEWGFLTNPKDNLADLPKGFEEYSTIVSNLGSKDGKMFRTLVNNLEQGLNQDLYVKKVDGLTLAELKRVYLTFTFIAQKYTKCEERKLDTIPYEIGLPWYHSAKKLGLPPVLTYAATILYNCKLDENNKLQTIYSISGTSDELHFYKVHITLENTCGKLICKLVEYAISPNTETALALSDESGKTIKEVTAILRTMYDECEPRKFWEQVRLYLSGFNDDSGFPNGLSIKNTEISFKFGGGSAAQSSLIQLLDIILGVDHESEHGKKFLLEQRDYMPKTHKEFLEFAENIFKQNKLKSIALTDSQVFASYNNAINELKVFRQAHYKLVHDYIVKFIKNPEHENEEKGVGGLMFVELAQYIKDTRKSRLIKLANVAVNPLSNIPWWLWACGTVCVAYALSRVL